MQHPAQRLNPYLIKRKKNTASTVAFLTSPCIHFFHFSSFQLLLRLIFSPYTQLLQSLSVSEAMCNSMDDLNTRVKSWQKELGRQLATRPESDNVHRLMVLISKGNAQEVLAAIYMFGRQVFQPSSSESGLEGDNKW